MQRLFIFAVLLGLTGCVDMYQQPYAVQQPPTITQTQGQCMASFKKVQEQTKCIQDTVAASNLPPNSYAQEYLAYMQLLQEQVKRKMLSESDARLKLTTKLNQVRAQQENEFAVQEQLANQRTAQAAEILKQNRPAPMQVYQPTTPILAPSIRTNCQTLGNQINCTSR